MICYRNNLRLVALAAMCALTIDSARAETGYRKTLLQWSYGTSFEGGPDVYEPLITDRPDFTESSVTVGYHVIQLETGYTFTHDSEGDDSTRSHSLPESLLRVGMFADWFEFRVDWNFIDELSEFGGVEETASGAEDLNLGMKLALTPQERILPETAIILQSSVPSGSSEFTADEVLPGVNFLYGWDITDEWATGGSTGLGGASDDLTIDSYVEFFQSWTVNRSWTEQLGSYTEWFVLVPSSADTNQTEHYFNGGCTFLISNDIQWDARAGVGLNEAADDFFAGTGLSLRYW